MILDAAYPKPGEAGGRLIRKVVAIFRAQGMRLPLERPVLIAVSGGADSTALAHLLSRYGRRICSPDQITLLHFDHGWRPESGGVEREGVGRFAAELGVRFLHRKLDPPTEGVNGEEDARKKRRAVYEELSAPGGAYEWVLTGHHQGDLAETLLWRFLRGEFDRQRKGILFQDSRCLRPFLEVEREEILEYVREEGLLIFEDPTNREPGRFRAWARMTLFPLLESRFPGIRGVLKRYAKVSNLEALLGGLPPGESISLPDGFQLKRLQSGWKLEKSDPPDPG
jgi:tRNA(Ile)-lysidine synthase